MGTRGLYMLHYEGKYYIVYNHDDSYYCGLCRKLLFEVKHAYQKDRTFALWKFKIKQLKSVRTTPTPEDIKQLKKYTDLTVSQQNTNDWYCLLKKCQGSFVRVLDSGHIIFPIETSLKKIIKQHITGNYMDIEYFYILDLDVSEFRYMSPQHDLIKFN
eukprot:64315_1